MRKTCLALALVAALSAPALAVDPPVRLAPLDVRFFNQLTGQWTPNKLDSKGTFTGWNTGAGEGDVGGPATDAMVVVALSRVGDHEEAAMLETPITIRATAGKKVIAMRRIPFLMVPASGHGYASAILPDIECAGKVDILVTYRSITRTARLNMDCGE